MTSKAPDVRAYVSSSRTLLVGIAVSILAVFLPVVIVPYAFSDDYPILSMADGLGSSPYFGKNILDAYSVNGRPLAGLLVNSVFSAAGTIDNLRFVRLAAVAGIVALALLLHWALVRSGLRPAAAALFVVFVCSMPSFQVYSSWTVLFAYPYAAILGGVASLFAIAAVDAPPNLVMDRMVGAVAALLAALIIYQSAAMFFWVFLAVAVVGSVNESRRTVRLVRTHLGVAAVALPLAFLVVKLGAYELGNTTANASRDSLTHDVVGNARWFVRQPLYQSLNLFDLTPSPWLAATVATVATVGSVLLLRLRGARPLPYLAIAVGLIPLSYLPSLVSNQNVAWYRTTVAITSLIALYACLGAVGIWLTVRNWLEPRVTGRTLIRAERTALGIGVTVVAASAFIAAKNVLTLFVEPQNTELRLIRSQVAALPEGVPRVAFLEPCLHAGMTDLVLYDEFGLPSSAAVWVPEPAVLLIFREQGRLASGPKPVVDNFACYATSFPTNEPLLDVRELQQLRDR